MVEAAQITAVINQIRDELSAEFPYHAGLASKLSDAVVNDWASVSALYCSGDWWGGSGSVFDISQSDAGQRRRIAKLLVDLTERFDAAGFKCAHASARADILRGWLSSGAI